MAKSPIDEKSLEQLEREVQEEHQKIEVVIPSIRQDFREYGIDEHVLSSTPV